RQEEVAEDLALGADLFREATEQRGGHEARARAGAACGGGPEVEADLVVAAVGLLCAERARELTFQDVDEVVRGLLEQLAVEREAGLEANLTCAGVALFAEAVAGVDPARGAL